MNSYGIIVHFVIDEIITNIWKWTCSRSSNNAGLWLELCSAYWLFSFHLAEHLHKHFLGLFSGNKLLIPVGSRLLQPSPYLFLKRVKRALRFAAGASNCEFIPQWAPGMLLPKHLPDSITPRRPQLSLTAALVWVRSSAWSSLSYLHMFLERQQSSYVHFCDVYLQFLVKYGYVYMLYGGKPANAVNCG